MGQHQLVHEALGVSACGYWYRNYGRASMAQDSTLVWRGVAKQWPKFPFKKHYARSMEYTVHCTTTCMPVGEA